MSGLPPAQGAPLPASGDEAPAVPSPRGQKKPPGFCCRLASCCCDYVHFIWLSRFLATASSLLIAVVTCWAAVAAASGAGSAEVAVVDVLFDGFLGIVALGLGLASLGCGIVLAQCQFLESWLGLGVSQIFLAVAALQDVWRTCAVHRDGAEVFLTVACYVVGATGLLFGVMGACGGKRVLERAVQRQARADEGTLLVAV